MIEAAYRAIGATLERVPGLVPTVDVPRRCEVLVHAASAGEVKAALALRAAADRPGGWLITSGTAAGVAMGADGRAPRDTPGAVGGALDAARPDVLLLIEAELWPTLLAEADRRGVPVAVVGARVSARAARRWERVPRGLRRSLLGRVSFWAAASDLDARRLIGIGVAPSRVETTGRLKFPDPPDAHAVEARRRDVIRMFPGRSGPLVVLGSVHPGETTALAEQARGTVLDADHARWLLAPRHPATRRLRAEAAAVGGTIEERFGVLRPWYGAADACFVGGGRTGRGVHDLLEPLAMGRRPIFFARRGDPSGTGAALASRGAAICLDEHPDLADALAPGPSPESVRAAWDGRRPTLDALARRGLLP